MKQAASVCSANIRSTTGAPCPARVLGRQSDSRISPVIFPVRRLNSGRCGKSWQLAIIRVSAAPAAPRIDLVPLPSADESRRTRELHAIEVLRFINGQRSWRAACREEEPLATEETEGSEGDTPVTQSGPREGRRPQEPDQPRCPARLPARHRRVHRSAGVMLLHTGHIGPYMKALFQAHHSRTASPSTDSLAG